ncbi:unnamed protein product [Absidia cylindrospora]
MPSNELHRSSFLEKLLKSHDMNWRQKAGSTSDSGSPPSDQPTTSQCESKINSKPPQNQYEKKLPSAQPQQTLQAQQFEKQATLSEQQSEQQAKPERTPQNEHQPKQTQQPEKQIKSSVSGHPKPTLNGIPVGVPQNFPGSYSTTSKQVTSKASVANEYSGNTKSSASSTSSPRFFKNKSIIVQPNDVASNQRQQHDSATKHHNQQELKYNSQNRQHQYQDDTTKYQHWHQHQDDTRNYYQQGQQDYHEEDFYEQRLFVSNLPTDSTADQLKEHFIHHGPIVNVVKKLNRHFGFVEFLDVNTCERALAMENKAIFQNRTFLKVQKSRPRPDSFQKNAIDIGESSTTPMPNVFSRLQPSKQRELKAQGSLSEEKLTHSRSYSHGKPGDDKSNDELYQTPKSTPSPSPSPSVSQSSTTSHDRSNIDSTGRRNSATTKPDHYHLSSSGSKRRETDNDSRRYDMESSSTSRPQPSHSRRTRRDHDTYTPNYDRASSRSPDRSSYRRSHRESSSRDRGSSSRHDYSSERRRTDRNRTSSSDRQKSTTDQPESKTTRTDLGKRAAPSSSSARVIETVDKKPRYADDQKQEKNTTHENETPGIDEKRLDTSGHDRKGIEKMDMQKSKLSDKTTLTPKKPSDTLNPASGKETTPIIDTKEDGGVIRKRTTSNDPRLAAKARVAAPKTSVDSDQQKTTSTEKPNRDSKTMLNINTKTSSNSSGHESGKQQQMQQQSQRQQHQQQQPQRQQQAQYDAQQQQQQQAEPQQTRQQQQPHLVIGKANETPIIQLISTTSAIQPNLIDGLENYLVERLQKIRCRTVLYSSDTLTRDEILKQVHMDGVQALILLENGYEESGKVFLQVFDRQHSSQESLHFYAIMTTNQSLSSPNPPPPAAAAAAPVSFLNSSASPAVKHESIATTQFPYPSSAIPPPATASTIEQQQLAGDLLRHLQQNFSTPLPASSSSPSNMSPVITSPSPRPMSTDLVVSHQYNPIDAAAHENDLALLSRVMQYLDKTEQHTYTRSDYDERRALIQHTLFKLDNIRPRLLPEQENVVIRNLLFHSNQVQSQQRMASMSYQWQQGSPSFTSSSSNNNNLNPRYDYF